MAGSGDRTLLCPWQPVTLQGLSQEHGSLGIVPTGMGASGSPRWCGADASAEPLRPRGARRSPSLGLVGARRGPGGARGLPLGPWGDAAPRYPPPRCVTLNSVRLRSFCSTWIFFPFNSRKKEGGGREKVFKLSPRNIRKITFFFPGREFPKDNYCNYSMTNVIFITCFFVFVFQREGFLGGGQRQWPPGGQGDRPERVCVPGRAHGVGGGVPVSLSHVNPRGPHWASGLLPLPPLVPRPPPA